VLGGDGVLTAKMPPWYDEDNTCAAKNEAHRGRRRLGKRRPRSAGPRAVHGVDARAWRRNVTSRRIARPARFGFAEPRFEHN
jgi:hypothetical protein